MIHEGWIAVALTVWGSMWLFGPLAQPRHDPSVISREWWRGYPLRPWPLARALSWTELLGIGPLITLACLSSLVVLAAPGGTAAVTAAIAAALAQLYWLIWAGKTVAALAGWLLQTRAGVTLAAVQTAIMLALSFAGWVPAAAWLLPRLGGGGQPHPHGRATARADDRHARRLAHRLGIRRGDRRPRRRRGGISTAATGCTAGLGRPSAAVLDRADGSRPAPAASPGDFEAASRTGTLAVLAVHDAAGGRGRLARAGNVAA
ncbi:hypothetical protein [Streptomyces ardesiacus]|uniref:hypothetical protein n=1 Tax=Streptomyces ardesiacus TaxID=285564 RepID=UPI00201F4E5F|nr:hypothetical protein [Streptomyces ardesiacus]MCL7370167.1 hypothetical protein [Streptomyces ardesiacus]